MDFSKITLMKAMQTRINYLGERQNVLSANIANADTPYYRAKDLPELRFRQLVSGPKGKLKMNVTDGSHISGSSPKIPNFRPIEMRDSWEQSPVENNVVLEQQMAMMSDNNDDYQKITGLYRKTRDMLLIAAGKPKGN